MKKSFLLLQILFVLTFFNVNAQGKNFTATDEYVKQLGPLNNLNVATIADTITRKFPDKYDKARAIFYWIANNIALDPKAIRANDNKKTDPVDVVQLRKTTPIGFALLVQEMCSMANIRCLTVDGYVKNYGVDINNKADDINHSWNVVQLGQSPEQWFYIDAAKASGFTDVKLTGFTKLFTSEYFFADKALFNLDHYPDNNAWQLGGGPKNLKEFYSLPVISNAAYKYGLQKPQPITGYIKTKTKNIVNFSFSYNSAIPIKNIFLQLGDEKKPQKPEPMNFNENKGVISFHYQFKRADVYPVRIVVDGKELLQYYVEADE
jgi:hypothetical protein